MMKTSAVNWLEKGVPVKAKLMLLTEKTAIARTAAVNSSRAVILMSFEPSRYFRSSRNMV